MYIGLLSILPYLEIENYEELRESIDGGKSYFAHLFMVAFITLIFPMIIIALNLIPVIQAWGGDDLTGAITFTVAVIAGTFLFLQLLKKEISEVMD